MVVSIVTGNAQKAAFLRECIVHAGGRAVTLIRPLQEMQTDSIESVARHKAAQALSHVAPPLLVEDAGLAIHSLRGFPGPVTRYAVETAGLEALIRMAPGASCTIESAIVMLDANNREHLFLDRLEGSLVETIGPGAAGDLRRAFVPKGMLQAFSALTPAQQEGYLLDRQKRISGWLKNLL